MLSRGRIPLAIEHMIRVADTLLQISISIATRLAPMFPFPKGARQIARSSWRPKLEGRGRAQSRQPLRVQLCEAGGSVFSLENCQSALSTTRRGKSRFLAIPRSRSQ